MTGWLINDEQWMAERKELWKKYGKILKNEWVRTSKELKCLREYFFTVKSRTT